MLVFFHFDILIGKAVNSGGLCVNDDDCETGTCVNATGKTKKCQGNVAVSRGCTNNWDCTSNSCVDSVCAGIHPSIIVGF